MTTTRDRIMNASAELFRRNGYSGTGLKQIVTKAQAPFGSIYHFFPGGKEELGAEVIRTSGMLYTQLFDIYIASADDLVNGIESAFAAAADTLVDTDYADACPIATVALEVASTNERLREATAEVFDAWIEAGTTSIIKFGIAQPDARDLAVSIITGLEGAFVLSRTLRTTEPITIAGASAATAARAALARGG